MGTIEVNELEPGLWVIRWTDGERRAENVIERDTEPQVREAVASEGNIVLLDENNQEVGRYNEVWRGEEFTCEETGRMMEDDNG